MCEVSLQFTEPLLKTGLCTWVDGFVCGQLDCPVGFIESCKPRATT